jgi:DNA-binding transcriptional MerR regulator
VFLHRENRKKVVGEVSPFVLGSNPSSPHQNAGYYFYAREKPFFMQTTVQAFNDAGFNVSSMKEILDLGVYVTTAIESAKTAHAISPETTENCCLRILEKEIDLFPKIKTILLMGDSDKGNELHRQKEHRQKNNPERLHVQNQEKRVLLQATEDLPFIPTDGKKLLD